MAKKDKLPERPVPIQKMAEILNMSVDEVKGLCASNKIPYIVTDKGTAWEAKRFNAGEVLKAVQPKQKKEDPL